MAFSYETAEAGGYGLVKSNLAHFRLVPGTFSMSDSYPAGGETLDLDRFFTQCMGVIIEPTNGYTFEYNPPTKKLKAFHTFADLSADVTPGEIAAGTAVDIEVSHSKLKSGDYLLPKAPFNLEAGLIPITAWVTEAGKAKIRIFNATADAITGTQKSWMLHAILTVPREVFAGANLSDLAGVRFIAWGI